MGPINPLLSPCFYLIHIYFLDNAWTLFFIFFFYVTLGCLRQSVSCPDIKEWHKAPDSGALWAQKNKATCLTCASIYKYIYAYKGSLMQSCVKNEDIQIEIWFCINHPRCFQRLCIYLGHAYCIYLHSHTLYISKKKKITFFIVCFTRYLQDQNIHIFFLYFSCGEVFFFCRNKIKELCKIINKILQTCYYLFFINLFDKEINCLIDDMIKKCYNYLNIFKCLFYPLTVDRYFSCYEKIIIRFQWN